MMNETLRNSDDVMLRLRSVARAQRNEDRELIKSLVSSRESQGLDIDEVAFRMGLTRNRLELIESGNVTPTLDEIGRYANCIGRKVVFSLEDA